MSPNTMDYITTTELRTKTKELVAALKRGKTIALHHRSRIIGEFRPVQIEQSSQPPKVFNAKRFAKLVKSLNLKPLSHRERDRIYRQHLEEKYGKFRPLK